MIITTSGILFTAALALLFIAAVISISVMLRNIDFDNKTKAVYLLLICAAVALLILALKTYNPDVYSNIQEQYYSV